jgi:hypothetical protein
VSGTGKCSDCLHRSDGWHGRAFGRGRGPPRPTSDSEPTHPPRWYRVNYRAGSSQTVRKVANHTGMSRTKKGLIRKCNVSVASPQARQEHSKLNSESTRATGHCAELEGLTQAGHPPMHAGRVRNPSSSGAEVRPNVSAHGAAGGGGGQHGARSPGLPRADRAEFKGSKTATEFRSRSAPRGDSARRSPCLAGLE